MCSQGFQTLPSNDFHRNENKSLKFLQDEILTIKSNCDNKVKLCLTQLAVSLNLQK